MKNTPENLFNQLLDLLENFKNRLEEEDVRTKVLALVPAHQALLKLGKSMIPDGLKISARDRIIAYFLRYPRTVIAGDEIMLISGISEWARRVRELRVQFGWAIVSGLAVNEMIEEGEFPIDELSGERFGLADYILLDDKQDMEAAFRWNVAIEIRKSRVGMKEKLILFLRKNAGKPVTGEELRYVAKGSEWARRIRELRTEEGWPISTKSSGRPDLAVGVYLLEQDRQTPKHDRVIPDPVRREVLRRDGYKCQKCGWNQDLWDRSDPRHLEIHHVERHADGGASTADNLITYCNVCHDDVHRLERTT